MTPTQIQKAMFLLRMEAERYVGRTGMAGGPSSDSYLLHRC